LLGTPIAGLGTPINVFGTPINVFGTPISLLGTPIALLGTPIALLGTPIAEFRTGDSHSSNLGRIKIRTKLCASKNILKTFPTIHHFPIKSNEYFREKRGVLRLSPPFHSRV
jgi:hypothetical protein